MMKIQRHGWWLKVSEDTKWIIYNTQNFDIKYDSFLQHMLEQFSFLCLQSRGKNGAF